MNGRDTDTTDCPDCGEAMYADAERCPNCGHWMTDDDWAAGPLPRRGPWRWVIVAMVVLVALVILLQRVL